MKFKKDVIIEGNTSTCCVIKSGDISRNVDSGDYYLVEAMIKRDVDKENLVKMIMNKENIDNMAASFALGQFIIDYAEFLEDKKIHYKIED